MILISRSDWAGSASVGQNTHYQHRIKEEREAGLENNSRMELQGDEAGEERQGEKYKYFIADFTNKGFDHSEDYGRNLEERLVSYVGEVDQDQDQDQVQYQDQVASKMKNNALVRRAMEQDRTLEFNDSKESTMI